ncbi:MAG TPA: LytTR family DNA-binding domain-containing protein [Sphingomicrobium sp.]|jgi:DNA-binding LytR/AlgR family response regulator|nr:LytTR family DNA-binding domain-containing protein [Sphingomicrobium sp.]
MIRVVMVDDEPLALDRLTDLLAQIEDVEIVGALRGGAEALEMIEAAHPDLVLLDIEMPRFDGFDVVEALLRDGHDTDRTPLICFVTAYPQFASEAFETGALDFLCKPVRLARLAKTIARARSAIEQREAARRLEELSTQLQTLRQKYGYSDDRCLWVQQRGEMVRLDSAKIDWLKAEGEYVRLHVGEGSFLLRTSITALAEELAEGGFVRVHRSVAINRARLKAVRRQRSGMKVVLESGIELPVGRKFRRQVADVVNG